jgi:hypothetical protein
MVACLLWHVLFHRLETNLIIICSFFNGIFPNEYPMENALQIIATKFYYLTLSFNIYTILPERSRCFYIPIYGRANLRVSVRNMGSIKQLAFIALYLDNLLQWSHVTWTKQFQWKIMKLCVMEPTDIIIQRNRTTSGICYVTCTYHFPEEEFCEQIYTCI